MSLENQDSHVQQEGLVTSDDIALALAVRMFTEFPGYASYGVFKDKIFFAIYKKIPQSSGTHESGRTNADILLEEIVRKLPPSKQKELVVIYQAVVSNVIDDNKGGDMVVDILFPKNKDSKYSV